MKTFSMNSLIGSSVNGEDIISDNDLWAELDINTYRSFYEDVKYDNGQELLSLLKVSDYLHINSDTPILHFVEYDLPVLIIEDKDAIKSLVNYLSNTPGCVPNKDQANEVAQCIRCRLPSKDRSIVCLYPFMLMPCSPPANLIDSPLLAHEMVHLRKTMTEIYDERAIRYTYWNKDLQQLMKTHLIDNLSYRITSYLLEEHEALQQNNTIESVNLALTQMYIPLALNGCASVIDWWLNDESMYLNISRVSSIISKSLFECLKDINYSDAHSKMTPDSWRFVSERVFREAYKYWQKEPHNFNELLKRSIAT